MNCLQAVLSQDHEPSLKPAKENLASVRNICQVHSNSHSLPISLTIPLVVGICQVASPILIPRFRPSRAFARDSPPSSLCAETQCTPGAHASDSEVAYTAQATMFTRSKFLARVEEMGVGGGGAPAGSRLLEKSGGGGGGVKATAVSHTPQPADAEPWPEAPSHTSSAHAT